MLAHVVGAVSLRVTGVSFAMVTLAFAQAGNVLARRNTGGLTGGEEGVGLRTDHVPDALVGVVNTRTIYWVALGVLVAVYVVVTWVQRSRAGHVVEATRENEMRVRVIGQQPYLIRLLTFVIAAALAAVIGMAYLVLQSQAVPGDLLGGLHHHGARHGRPRRGGLALGRRSSAPSSTPCSTSASASSPPRRSSTRCPPCSACR